MSLEAEAKLKLVEIYADETRNELLAIPKRKEMIGMILASNPPADVEAKCKTLLQSLDEYVKDVHTLIHKCQNAQ